MAEQTKQEFDVNKSLDHVKGFWEKNNKTISILGILVILISGGYWGYGKFIKEPKEEKALESLFKAEEYFRMDSLDLALNGDGLNYGFLKVIDKYSGTEAANLAHYYAGACYLNKEEHENAVKHLKDFSTEATQVQAMAYGMLGDAYSSLNKNEEAVSSYKKAATENEKDEYISSEYLFRAGLLLETMGKNAEAIEMYKKIQSNYPRTERGFEVEKYLARLGVTE